MRYAACAVFTAALLSCFSHIDVTPWFKWTWGTVVCIYFSSIICFVLFPQGDE